MQDTAFDGVSDQPSAQRPVEGRASCDPRPAKQAVAANTEVDMSEEGSALIAWVSALQRSGHADAEHAVAALRDLADGTVLLSVLIKLDSSFFLSSRAAPAARADSKLQTLERIHGLIVRYFEEQLRADVAKLRTPDLQAIAEHDSERDLADLVSLVLVLAVQSDKREEHVAVIQSLDLEAQTELMRIIERHVSQISGLQASPELSKHALPRFDGQDEAYDRLKVEWEALQAAHQELLKQHNNLRDDQDRALLRVKELEASAETTAKPSEIESSRRAEMENLQLQLSRAEAALNEAETTVERLQTAAVEAEKRIEELSERATEGDKLRDEIDEYRHAADRLQKSENTLAKYKVKLEEAADVRRALKTLEDQNTDLLDRYSKLEEDYRRAAAGKGVGEQYRSQVETLEASKTASARELEALRTELAQVKGRLEVAEEEKRQEAETTIAYEERIRELETRASTDADGSAELSADLDNAVSASSVTDLKLQIRRLTRQLEDARAGKSDESSADAARLQARYQDDYLREHRAHLQLQKTLEDIRSGKGGASAQQAAALRLQLDETLEAHKALQQTHAETHSQLATSSQYLRRAESDLKLVDRDRLDMLAALRDEVTADKKELEDQLSQLQTKLQNAQDENTMQLSQINSLLLDKVDMQGAGIEQRDVMLKQEKEMSDLRLAGAGSGEMQRLQEELAQAKAAAAATAVQLTEARNLVRRQHEKIQASEQRDRDYSESSDEALRSDNQLLREENERIKTLSKEMEERYQREQKLIMSAWHNMGIQRLRDQAAANATNGKVEKVGWLGQQRARARMQY